MNSDEMSIWDASRSLLQARQKRTRKDTWQGGGSELVGVSMAIPESIFLTDLYYKWEKSSEANRNGVHQILSSNIETAKNTHSSHTLVKFSTSTL